MVDDLAYASIGELASWIRQERVSSEEVVRAKIERTKQLDPKLNSYITFRPDQALEQARKVDQEIRNGSYRGPLHGIPVSIKDHIDTADMPTTSGAKSRLGNTPQKDAGVTRRLRQAGVVVMGKANMNKFAAGDSGDNPDFGKIRTPWNLEFAAGGSSGGSGAQVAAGLVPLSVGSDNGGSIRIPAAVCGIVGLKPTYGRVSLDGIFPRMYTCDHAGPLTRTVEDCAVALRVLAGHDPLDPSTIRKPVPDYAQLINEVPRSPRIGVDRKFVSFGEPAVLARFDEALKKLEAIGGSIREVTIPSVEDLFAVANALLAEFAVSMWRIWTEHPADIDPGDIPYLAAGATVPAVDYIRASQQRWVLQKQYAEATRDVDVLACPTYPLERRPFGKYRAIGGKEITLDDAIRYTLPFDVLGLPAISIPCGFSDEGFPIGLQLVGRAFEETTVLRMAHMYEQSTEWHRRQPSI